MSEFSFGLHYGHLTAKADQIARRHSAWHTNYTEPNGRKRGWFGCRNLGSPFDQATARAVLDDICDAGGFEALIKTPSQSLTR